MTTVLAVLALLLQTQATNAELGYRFALPSGFTAFPEARSQKDMVDCWSEATPVSAHGAMILCVQRMRGVLPREAMRQEDVPTTTQLVSFKWKEFDLQGLRSLVSQRGEQAFVLVTQVPLRREAVQLFLSGPADQEARGQALLTETLASLEGESNWLSASERSGRLGNIAGWWIGIAVAVIAVLVWRKRRRAASR
ncbi:MAG: hypothetical protein DMD44_02485 [Gemmatimonadetes bacterium]|nr:MAG: hypothetical protein DMD44_02485 [Gemmatimonadota bacterium]